MARVRSIETVGVGVAGYGCWGSPLVRNIVESPELRLRAMCQTESPQTFGEHQLTRTGDMVAPRIDVAEPLSLVLQDFAHAIRTGASPRSSAALRLGVVRALEAASTSMERNGVPVTIERSHWGGQRGGDGRAAGFRLRLASERSDIPLTVRDDACWRWAG